MNELIDRKLLKLYHSLIERPNQILSIFNDFFGEDRVDMQNCITFDKFKYVFYNFPICKYLVNYPYEQYNNVMTELSDEFLYAFLDNLHSSDIIANMVHFKYLAKISGKLQIIVHFPEVEITNEYGKFTTIKNLYAKIHIGYNGLLDGVFSLNRSEYSLLHYVNSYMHSHVREIPYSDFTKFQIPCLGSGPIRNTMLNLNTEFDENVWGLFCLELNKYIETESLDGVPYHRLENLILGEGVDSCGINNFILVNKSINTVEREIFWKFIPYFINQKCLKFNYVGNNYLLGMSFIEYIIIISNHFIEWYNNEYNKKTMPYSLSNLIAHDILHLCKIVDGKMRYNTASRRKMEYIGSIGCRVCDFKGKNITISITEDAQVRFNESIIINPMLALTILTRILFIINYKYGKPRNDQNCDEYGERISFI